MTPAPERPGDEGGTSAALAVPSFVLISISRIAVPAFQFNVPKSFNIH
jgi:hypothetical protein